MLYNIEKKELKTDKTCIGCAYYDKRLKKCDGLNKCCFEYDPKTQTVIDGITKMPMKIEK